MNKYYLRTCYCLIIAICIAIITQIPFLLNIAFRIIGIGIGIAVIYRLSQLAGYMADNMHKPFE